MKPQIIFEDDDILVIHKPAGLSTQTSRVGAPDCVSELKILLHERDGINDPYLGIIHRLDQPVEGILVFAKNKESAAALSKDIQKNRFWKEYRAVVKSEEVIEQRQHHLIDYMVTDRIANLSRIVEQGENQAKKAELYYEPVASRVETGLGEPFRIHELKILLMTGRHHQIRLQLSHAGLPILGDSKYGAVPPGYNGPLGLAACKLAFLHPRSRQKRAFSIEADTLKEI